MDLQKEILKCLAFYDIFKYPLVPHEIWKNLGVKAELREVLAALEKLEKENPGSRAELTTGHCKIVKKDGYFFLPQNSDLSAERKARFLISFYKLQKAKRLAHFFSHFPFVRFIGVCNSLGIFNAREESDIDFFIIAKGGCLWTTRFLTTAFLILFNLRPSPGVNKDRFCLSFYVADDASDISRAALPGGDPYFYHWFSWIMPLCDDGVWQEFITQNGWIKNYLPNFLAQDAVKAVARPRSRRVMEKLFFLPEKFFRWGQTLAMPRALKKATARGDGSVVISDTMLKFHLLDRRAEYRERFYQKIKFLNDQIINPNDQSKN